MDTLFILAGLLGVGDLLLLRVVAHERARRQKAESNANIAIRDNYRLLDALERKAGIRPPARSVVVPMRSSRRGSGLAAGTLGGSPDGVSPDPRPVEQEA